MALAAWGALVVGELLNVRRRIRAALIGCFLIALGLLIGPQFIAFPSMEVIAPAIILGGALGSAVLYTKVSPVPSLARPQN